MKLSDFRCVCDHVNLDDYLKLYKYVRDGMENPNWLGAFTKKEIKDWLNLKGKIWLYYSGEDLVCSMFLLPSNNKTLNKHKVFQEADLVASLGPIMVSPLYRGNHLQLQMMEVLEDYCKNHNYQYLYTKVCSDNIYSLSNIYEFGFLETDKYENDRGNNISFLKKIA